MGRKPTSRSRKTDAGAAGTVRDRIIDAALAISAVEGWGSASLTRIADAAGVTLAELQAEFAAKPLIIDAFLRRLDAQVLAGGPTDADDAARDRLFEVLMRRFDALTPHKAAIAALQREILDPTVAVPVLCGLGRSMAWMLEAAGLSSSGLGGLIRIKGLALVCANAMRVWLRDDSADMAKTMAALDRGLRQAEGLVDLACHRRRRTPEPEPEPNI